MASPLAEDVHLDVQMGADGRVEIPLAVRRALALQAHDRLRFSVTADGRVSVQRIGPGRAPVDAPTAADGLPQALGLLAGLLSSGAPGSDPRLSKVDPALMNDLGGIIGSALDPRVKPGSAPGTDRNKPQP